MPYFSKPHLITALFLLLSLPALPSRADVSANIGLSSDYFFRGIDQQAGATASFGLDLEQGGFSSGTWFADVVDGLEYDLYGAYSIKFNKTVSLKFGYTGYFYTGETFDDTYSEGNLHLTLGPINIEHSAGTHDLLAGGDEDYTFTAITVEHGKFSGTIGNFGDAFKGSYVELGFQTEVNTLDVGVSLIFGDEDLSNQFNYDSVSGAPASTPNSDASIVFSIGKSFSL